MTSRLLLAFTLLGCCLATACGPKINVPEPPVTAYIPTAGAAVGTTIENNPLTTVRVSPNEYEVQLLHLINELRTKGTIAGEDLRAGTCAASFQPRADLALSYSGVLAYAARKHAIYMGSVGYYAHNEQNIGNTGNVSNEPDQNSYFYGTTRQDRVQRALNEFNLTDFSFLAGSSSENVAAGTTGEDEKTKVYVPGFPTPRDAMVGWLHSDSHCSAMINPQWNYFGTGYFRNDSPVVRTEPKRHRDSWVQVFSVGKPRVQIVIVN